MIPIWAKDKEGKWQVFPGHLLTVFPDGAYGFAYQHTEIKKLREFDNWIHLFTYDTRRRSYMLTKQPKEEKL